MSENAIATPESAYDVLSALKDRNQSKYVDKQAIAQVTKVGDWVPYIQIMQSTSAECKEKGFPMGSFALNKNRQKIDIGKSLVAMMLSWRPKAMQYLPTTISAYNPNSELFKKIEVESAVKDSNKGFGPEFLLWLPDVDGGIFASFFMGNPTGRVEAPNFIAAYEKGQLSCRLTSELIKDKKNGRSWFGARYYPYEVAITNQPPRERLMKVVDKFNNPPETDQGEPGEKAEGDSDGDRG